LKINVTNIPEEGLKVRFSKDEAWFRQVFTEKENLGLPINSVEGSVTLKRVRDTLYLEGDIRTETETDCSRCLEAASLPIGASFKYVLSPAPAEHSDEEQELSPEDLDVVYYLDDLIDLDPLIIEQVLLQIPMKVLCREDCRGLCPRCGINLNRNSCRCHDEHVDSRLAVLKKLKV
jgi:uncharacterized protein